MTMFFHMGFSLVTSPRTVPLFQYTVRLPNADIILMEAQSTSWTEVQRLEAIAFEEGLYQMSLENLQPNTAYNICAFTDDIRSTVSRFRTAPDTSMKKITFGATSCMSSNRPWPSLTQTCEPRL